MVDLGKYEKIPFKGGLSFPGIHTTIAQFGVANNYIRISIIRPNKIVGKYSQTRIMALFSWTMTLTKTTRGGSLMLVLKIVFIGNSRSAMTLFADAPRGVVWPCTQKLAAWSGLTTYTISYRRRRCLLSQEPIPGILSLKTTILDLNIRNKYYRLISKYT